MNNHYYRNLEEITILQIKTQHKHFCSLNGQGIQGISFQLVGHLANTLITEVWLSVAQLCLCFGCVTISASQSVLSVWGLVACSRQMQSFSHNLGAVCINQMVGHLLQVRTFVNRFVDRKVVMYARWSLLMCKHVLLIKYVITHQKYLSNAYFLQITIKTMIK